MFCLFLLFSSFFMSCTHLNKLDREEGEGLDFWYLPVNVLQNFMLTYLKSDFSFDIIVDNASGN